MYGRYIMIFGAMVLLGACTGNKESSNVQTGVGQETVTFDNQNYANEPTPGTEADFVVNVGDRVFFDYDSYSLTPEARTTLENQVRWLESYPNLSVIIEGHTDERGTREYNLALGERRANAVKNYMIALGISPSRISTISYGKERPAELGSNEYAWSRNRRAVTDIQ